MSGLLACFTCTRKHKKSVRPSAARSTSTDPHSCEQMAYLRASTQSMLYVQEAEGVTQRRRTGTKVTNKPLKEYKFPRMESMFEAKVNTSS